MLRWLIEHGQPVGYTISAIGAIVFVASWVALARAATSRGRHRE